MSEDDKKASVRESQERAQDKAEFLQDFEENEQELNELAREIEEKARAKTEAKAGEKLNGAARKKLEDNLEEIISLFSGLESRKVLSYRIESYAEGVPSVVQFAIKETRPITIRITNKAAILEKLPSGKDREIKHGDLTKNYMTKLIKDILRE